MVSIYKVLSTEVWRRVVDSAYSAFATPLASDMVSQGQPFASSGVKQSHNDAISVLIVG